MKKLILTLAAATAIAATPAVAQYGAQASVNAGGGAGIANRIDQLEDRLEAGIDTGAIDRNEARSLRQQIRQLNRLESQYSRNGLTQQERQDLQQRIRTVRQQLRVADGGNNNGRYADWDRDDDFGQNNSYGNNRYQEVSQVCAQASGITGILRGILGNDNCLRVGERVTGNLAQLPSQYRNEFRDGNGFYYGYLDGNVVQIDSRTRVVARIYDVG